jgi:hypothetical protein
MREIGIEPTPFAGAGAGADGGVRPHSVAV